MLNQTAAVWPCLKQPSFPLREHLVLGPGPSNRITALFFHDAQLEESRCHQQASPAVVPMASKRACVSFYLPGLSLPTPCPAATLLAVGDLPQPVKRLRRPPDGTKLLFIFCGVLNHLFFFFSPLPSWDCDPPPSSRDRIRARDPCGIPPKPTSPKVIRPDNISSSVGGRLGTQGALGSQHSLRPVPDLSQQPPKLAVGFYGFLQWIKDSTRVLSPPHLPSLPVLRSSAGAAGPLVG